MKTCVSTSLACGLRTLGQTALLFAMQVGNALAATTTLAPGLDLKMPTPLIVESMESATGPVLVGAIDGKPGYFLAATKIESWDRNKVLWDNLETAMREQSLSGELHVGMRGTFTTIAGDDVWYRVYEYQASSQQHRQVYYLLKGDNVAYWLTLTAVEGVSFELAIPIANALIRRVQLTD